MIKSLPMSLFRGTGRLNLLPESRNLLPQTRNLPIQMTNSFPITPFRSTGSLNLLPQTRNLPIQMINPFVIRPSGSSCPSQVLDLLGQCCDIGHESLPNNCAHQALHSVSHRLIGEVPAKGTRTDQGLHLVDREPPHVDAAEQDRGRWTRPLQASR
jgi:hypothetical protein